MNKSLLSNNRGFTLVEVLIAVTIFGIVVSTLYSSFNIIISNINPMNTSLDDYGMAQNTMDRITKDLASLYLTSNAIYSPPDMETDDNAIDRFRFVSQAISINANSFSQLRFASLEHISFNRNQKPGIGIIKYYTEKSENGAIVLKRSDIGLIFYDGNQEDDSYNEPVLCERVLAFKLEFTDHEGKNYEEWDSDSSDFNFASPYSINIKLEIGDDNKTNVFETTIVLPVQREKNES